MTSIKLHLDPTEKILLKRNLEKDGQAQRFMTSEIRRLADPYTPMDSSTLKNNVTMGAHTIKYNSPYARYQYFGVSKNGVDLKYNGAPMRGKKWVERCWADRHSDIVEAVARFVGGRTK